MKCSSVISAVSALFLLVSCNVACNKEQPSRGEPGAQPGAPGSAEGAAGEKGPAPANAKDEGASAPAPGAAAQPVKPGVPVLEDGVPLAGDWDGAPPLAAQWLTGGKAVLFQLERTGGDGGFKLTATVDGAKTDLMEPAINPARGGQVIWLLRGDGVVFAYTSNAASQDEGTASAARYALRDGKVIQDEIWHGSDLDTPPQWVPLATPPTSDPCYEQCMENGPHGPPGTQDDWRAKPSDQQEADCQVECADANMPADFE